MVPVISCESEKYGLMGVYGPQPPLNKGKSNFFMYKFWCYVIMTWAK